MERCDEAVVRKHEMGMNCCQAVLLAFAAEIKERWTGCDESLLLELGRGFGSGMGSMDASCGALVGAGMAAGLLGCSSRNLSSEFKERVGALRCADIKGVRIDPDTGKVIRGKILCSCDDCVRHAVRLIEKETAE